MIDIREVHQFVTQTKRSGTSGYDNKAEWNANIKSTEIEIYRDLIPLYAKDDRIQKFMNPFLETVSLPVTTEGYVTLPDNFNKYVDTIFGEGDKIVYPRNINEKSTILASSILNPKIESDEYFCFFEGNRISYLPKEVTDAKVVYLRKPVPAEIDFILEETDDRDYIRVSPIKDSEWPEELFNLYCAIMLEKFGFQNRESVAIEYGRLGIEKNIKQTAQ